MAISTYQHYSVTMGLSSNASNSHLQVLGTLQSGQPSNVIAFDPHARKAMQAMMKAEHPQQERIASTNPSNGASPEGVLRSQQLFDAMAPHAEKKDYNPGPQMPFSPPSAPTNS